MSHTENTSGGSKKGIAINTLWNLFGQATPILAAYFSIPPLIKGLGLERFGLLTMVWFMIGYFSLFDLGLGRSLTLVVSEKIGSGSRAEIPRVVVTALFAMLMLGILACLLLFGLSGFLVKSILSVPVAYEAEADSSIRVLAFAIPVVIITTGLRGVLEAFQRFDLINLVRVPLGILTFVAPLILLKFTNALNDIVFGLLVVRLGVFVLHVGLCRYVVPDFLSSVHISRRYLSSLLSLGGWMTVTNIISPVMVYLDRFMIGGVLGLTSVAYYVTPYELITKLLIVPTAIMGVLFPAFSSALVSDRERAVSLFGTGLRWIFMGLFPAVLVTVVFAKDILAFWLSGDFAQHSTVLMQVLSVGVLINSLAHVPFGFIQAEGRPDITAKFHLVELPLYLIGLYFAMSSLGLLGVAIAWTARVTLDALILLAFCAWRDKKLSISPLYIGLFFLLMGVLFGGSLINSPSERIIFGSILLALFGLVAWRKLFLEEEQNYIRSKLFRLSRCEAS